MERYAPRTIPYMICKFHADPSRTWSVKSHRARSGGKNAKSRTLASCASEAPRTRSIMHRHHLRAGESMCGEFQSLRRRTSTHDVFSNRGPSQIHRNRRIEDSASPRHSPVPRFRTCVPGGVMNRCQPCSRACKQCVSNEPRGKVHPEHRNFPRRHTVERLPKEDVTAPASYRAGYVSLSPIRQNLEG